MTTATNLRALRVGVLLRDKLVEDKLVRGPTAVTIGQSLRCMLSVPAEGMPNDHVLFAVDQGQVLLRLTDQMSGRLAQDGTIRSELRGTPDGVVTIPLARGARGRVQIGEATVLFQEVAAPPLPPRPRLPAAVRGSLADRIDPRLALIVACSLLAHFGIAIWAWATDPEHDVAAASALTDYLPAQYDTYNITAPDLEPSPLPPSTEPGVAPPVAPTQTARPIVPRGRHDAMPTPEDPDLWARMMTNNTPGPNGQGELSSRQPGATLDKQIEELRRRNGDVTVGGSPKGFRDTDPHHLGNGPDGPHIADPQLTKLTPAHDETPVRIVLVPSGPKQPPHEVGTLTADMVVDRIKTSYMVGLQRCYRLDLVHDQTLSGKIAISFTVDEKGHTIDSAASGLTSTIDACVSGIMAGWRFPVPKDKDGDPMELPFKVVLSLQAS